MSNNSERPVDALAENGKLLTHSLTDNFKSRDASASKKMHKNKKKYKNGPGENLFFATIIVSKRILHGFQQTNPLCQPNLLKP